MRKEELVYLIVDDDDVGVGQQWSVVTRERSDSVDALLRRPNCGGSKLFLR